MQRPCKMNRINPLCSCESLWNGHVCLKDVDVVLQFEYRKDECIIIRFTISMQCSEMYLFLIFILWCLVINISNHWINSSIKDKENVQVSNEKFIYKGEKAILISWVWNGNYPLILATSFDILSHNSSH